MIAISDLVYIDASGERIDMTVDRDGEIFPFTLSPGDNAPVAIEARTLLAGGGYVIAPYIPPEVTADVLRAGVAQVRWEKEVGGITVSGVPVATDDRSKQMIIGARLAALADGNFETKWKVGAGVFVTLGAADILAISDAVAAHVAACFAKESEVSAGIAGETITTLAQIDAAFAAIVTAY